MPPYSHYIQLDDLDEPDEQHDRHDDHEGSKCSDRDEPRLFRCNAAHHENRPRTDHAAGKWPRLSRHPITPSDQRLAQVSVERTQCVGASHSAVMSTGCDCLQRTTRPGEAKLTARLPMLAPKRTAKKIVESGMVSLPV